MARKAMVIDLNKCVGCLACVVACKSENNVEIGKYWTWVERVDSGKFPKSEMYFLPKVCQHCDTPECITVCPTQASYKREDGVVLVKQEDCIGCEQCIEACPYKVRVMNDNGIAEKCTLCSQLTDKGERSNCEINCPGQARMIGDLDNPNSNVSVAIKEAGKDFHQFKNVGNNPAGGYILRKIDWKSGK